jgi:hypothetical protein
LNIYPASLEESTEQDNNEELECFKLPKDGELIISFPPRKLSGIRLKLHSSLEKHVSFIVWGQENGQFVKYSNIHQTNLANGTILMFKNRFEELDGIKLRSKSDIAICDFESLTLSVSCGHPEIPLNGHVYWKLNDDRAIYKCYDGYELSTSSTRDCSKGMWIGSEPICRISIFKFELICITFFIILLGVPSSEVDTSNIGIIGVGVIVGVFLTVLVVVILLLLWKLER